MKQGTKQHQSHFMRSLVGACGLLLMMSGGRATSAQQTVKAPEATAVAAHPAPKPQMEEEETAKPDKPGEQGIKIHGHWVIDVRNPDGTLIRHKDFQNSLVTQGLFVSGDQLLAGLLSGNVTAGDPAIAFVTNIGGSTDATSYCSGTFGGGCFFLTTSQSLLTANSYIASTSLQTGMSARVNFSPTVSWVLSGNFTVPSGQTSFLYVQTVVPTCVSGNVLSSSSTSTLAGTMLTGSASDRYADLSSKTCVPAVLGTNGEGEIIFPFTSTLIPNEPFTGMPVTPGQIITVTVTISFS